MRERQRAGATVSDGAVCRIIGSVLGRPATGAGVAPEMDLRADLGLDSVGLMSVVFLLEEELGIAAFDHVQAFIEAQQVSDIIEIVRRG